MLEMAQAKNGMAKEVVANIDVSELMEFARYKFPDISEQTVRANFNELLAGTSLGNA